MLGVAFPKVIFPWNSCFEFAMINAEAVMSGSKSQSVEPSGHWQPAGFELLQGKTAATGSAGGLIPNVIVTYCKEPESAGVNTSRRMRFHVPFGFCPALKLFNDCWGM